jgi:hypothetical protein
MEVFMTRIHRAIADRPAMVGLLLIVASLVVAACNNGSGGGSGY